MNEKSEQITTSCKLGTSSNLLIESPYSDKHSYGYLSSLGSSTDSHSKFQKQPNIFLYIKNNDIASIKNHIITDPTQIIKEVNEQNESRKHIKIINSIFLI